MNAINLADRRKLADLLFYVLGILLMVWRWLLDSTKADYLEIWKMILPDWWWSFASLALVTAVSYTHLKPKRTTGYVEKILRSKLWGASIFMLTIGFLFFCSKDRCETLFIDIGESLAAVTSLFQLLVIVWIEHRRK